MAWTPVWEAEASLPWEVIVLSPPLAQASPPWVLAFPLSSPPSTGMQYSFEEAFLRHEPPGGAMQVELGSRMDHFQQATTSMQSLQHVGLIYTFSILEKTICKVLHMEHLAQFTLLPSGLLPSSPSVTIATSCPTATVSSSLTSISLSLPGFPVVYRTSTVTLSVSICRIMSSVPTASPVTITKLQ